MRDDLETKLAEKEKQVTDLEELSSGLKKQCDTLKSDLDLVIDELAVSKEAVKTETEKSSELEQKIALMEVSLNKPENNSDQGQGDCDDLQAKVNDLQEEQEMLMGDMQKKEEQMAEWEHLMHMMTEDKDRMLQELDAAEARDIKLVDELDLLRCTLSEVLDVDTEPADDVFETDDNEEAAVLLALDKVKGLIQQVVPATSKLKQDLESAYVAKGDNSVEIHTVKRELEQVREEKDTLEREKESLSVIVQLSKEKEAQMNETIDNNDGEQRELRELCVSLKEQLEQGQKDEEDLLIHKNSKMTVTCQHSV